MKIALIGYLHGSGGAERQIIMLSNELAEKGYDVHLITLADNNAKYEISPKVRVYDCSDHYSNAIVALVCRYSSLKKLYKKINPDITIHYWLQSAYLTALMPSGKRGKIIYSERSNPENTEHSCALKYIRGLAFRRIDGFVFQSEGARDYFGKEVDSRSVVIHNSVSIPETIYSVPSKDREARIVSVGRLHPQKNFSLLIDAFSKLPSDFHEYTMEIYGDGELRSELQAKIDTMGLADRIYLRGSCKDIFDRIYKAALFVLTSDYEGMPNALMEAMALGIPCVSTDCRPGGARMLIRDGENGYIVPIGDTDALTQKMAYLLKNRKKAEEIAFAAQNIRITNSSKEIFDKWNGFIQKIADGSEQNQ